MAVPALKMEKKRQRESCSSFTQRELEVAQILTQLECLFHQSNPLRILSWGCKRKRSALDENPSFSSPSRRVLPSHLACVTEKHRPETEASSPATPLSFSPSDLDTNSKRCSRTRGLQKKTNKELKEMEAVLAKQRQNLRRELEKVTAYYNELEAENLLLKRRQLELGKNDLNASRGLYTAEEPLPGPSTFLEEEQHGPTNYLPSMAERLGPSTSPIHYRVPDLNFSAEEAPAADIQFQFDLNNRAAMAAQARKRRIEINRVKSSLAMGFPRLR